MLPTAGPLLFVLCTALPLCAQLPSPAAALPTPSSGALSFREQASIYLHRTFSVGAFMAAAAPATFRMVSPPRTMDTQWRQGTGGFGRNLGDFTATELTASTTRFLYSAAMREDPRYVRSQSGSVPLRILHAIAWTGMARSSSGHPRPSLAVFASAAAGGFVTTTYAAPGFADSVHAGQRALMVWGGAAASNIFEEFAPEIKRLRARLHH